MEIVKINEKAECATKAHVLHMTYGVNPRVGHLFQGTYLI